MPNILNFLRASRDYLARKDNFNQTTYVIVGGADFPDTSIQTGVPSRILQSEESQEVYNFDDKVIKFDTRQGLEQDRRDISDFCKSLFQRKEAFHELPLIFGNGSFLIHFQSKIDKYGHKETSNYQEAELPMKRKLAAYYSGVTNDGSGNYSLLGTVSPDTISEWANYLQVFQYFRILTCTVLFVPFAPAVARGQFGMAIQAGADDVETLSSITNMMENILLGQNETEKAVVFPAGTSANKKVTVKHPDKTFYEMKATLTDQFHITLLGEGGTANQQIGSTFIVWDIEFK